MSRIWSSGFELNSKTNTVEFDSFGASGTGSTSIVTSPVRSGTYAGRCLNAGSNAVARIDQQFLASDANGPFYFRMFLRVADLPSAVMPVLLVTDVTGSNTYGSIYIDTDGTLLTTAIAKAQNNISIIYDKLGD